MKLDDQITPDQELVVTKRKQQEYNLIDKYVPRIDGGVIWEYDPATDKMERATFQRTTDYVIGMSENKKLHIVKGRIYVEAINEKNARKRVRQGKIFHKS